MMTFSHPERGAALIVVLLFIALISSLTMTAIRTSLSINAAAAAFADQMRADELGRNAAHLVTYYL